MSICIECGEFELIYVLACGDGAVGESKVLFFAGEELAELHAEMREMDEAFRALETSKNQEDPDQVVQAQDHLAEMLKGYIEPMSHLPGQHLVQAYAMNGKKWTRIRSDKMRNHWRSYDIDKSLLVASDAGGKSQLDKPGLASAFREVANKVKDDLTGGGITFKQQVAKGEVSAGILEIWDEDWAKWVDAVNESLTYSNNGANHDLSAGAQLLRAYAGFGLELGYNPKKNSYGLTGHAEAKAILAEGSVTFDGYVPHRDGWHALIPYGASGSSEAGNQHELNFGYFRGRLTIKAQAMLGASIFGTAGIEYQSPASGHVQAQPAMAGAKGEVSAGAFAGVEAGGDVTGAIEWLNPGLIVDGQTVKNADWGNMISVGGGVAANAGIGAEVNFKITFEQGKFMFRCQAQLVVGLGAKGSISGAIGFDKMYEFVMYLYNQLKDNDFSYLEFMDEGAFNFVVGAILYAIEKGIDLARVGAVAVMEVLGAVQQLFSEPQAAEDYARTIKARPGALIFAPPEAKGAILYRLSETYLFSFEEHQEAAILTVVGTVQTQAEWNKILERITPTGQKGISRAAGLRRLNYILDGGSQTSFNSIVAAIGSLPPTTMYAGSPVRVQTIA